MRVKPKNWIAKFPFVSPTIKRTCMLKIVSPECRRRSDDTILGKSLMTLADKNNANKIVTTGTDNESGKKSLPV